MLHYEELKNKPREMLAATGLKANEFEALLVALAKRMKGNTVQIKGWMGNRDNGKKVGVTKDH